MGRFEAFSWGNVCEERGEGVLFFISGKQRKGHDDDDDDDDRKAVVWLICKNMIMLFWLVINKLKQNNNNKKTMVYETNGIIGYIHHLGTGKPTSLCVILKPIFLLFSFADLSVSKAHHIT